MCLSGASEHDCARTGLLVGGQSLTCLGLGGQKEGHQEQEQLHLLRKSARVRAASAPLLVVLEPRVLWCRGLDHTRLSLSASHSSLVKSSDLSGLRTYQ